MEEAKYLLAQARLHPSLRTWASIREKLAEQFAYYPDTESRTRSARRSRWAGAYLLRELTGMSYREIAALLGFKDASVTKRSITRAQQIGAKEGWWDIVLRIERDILDEILGIREKAGEPK